jgi:hypothetical protein
MVVGHNVQVEDNGECRTTSLIILGQRDQQAAALREKDRSGIWRPPPQCQAKGDPWKYVA